MNHAHTLADLIQADAQLDELPITYIDSGTHERRITLGELRERALGILFHLQNAGLQPGDELIVFTNDQEQFIDVFWACVLGGIVPVPVAVGASDDHRFKLFNIHSSLHRPWLFTARGLLRRLQDFAGEQGLQEQLQSMLDRTVYVDDIEDVTRAGNAHPSRPSDTAFIQFSSGSTSAPKGVLLSHANVLSNIRSIIKTAAFTRADRSLSWMPLTHDMGLIGFHLTMTAAGIEHFIMDTSLFVRRPLLWLEKASEKRATLLCSPNFGYKHALKLLGSKGLGAVDLSHVRLIFNGAEPISVELARAFMDELAPFGLRANSMYCVYGLAEASLAVTFPEPGSPMQSVTVHRHALNIGEPFQPAGPGDSDAIVFARLGRPIEGTEVRICDDQDQELPADHIGHVQIRGANVTRGYHPGNGEQQQVFAAGDWLRTGDLGAWVEGQLVITGRSKEIIFVNGQNYYPHDLEHIAQQIDSLELGKVVVSGTTGPESGDDHILVFLLHRGDAQALLPVARKLRAHLNSSTGLEVHAVVPVPRIPKTTSGKIQRHRLVQAWLDGEFEAAQAGLEALESTMAEQSDAQGTGLEAMLHGICNEVIIDRSVGLDDNLFDIGVSSLALAQIHERIEEIHPGKMDIVDVFDYPSIRELAAFMSTKLR